jgi:hypothetical protein
VATAGIGDHKNTFSPEKTVDSFKNSFKNYLPSATAGGRCFLRRRQEGVALYMPPHPSRGGGPGTDCDTPEQNRIAAFPAFFQTFDRRLNAGTPRSILEKAFLVKS